MRLIQILLPLYDNGGKHFPPESYSGIREELTERFGGLTAFTRSPAEGLWKDASNAVSRDDIVVFEVMVEKIDWEWWRGYKASLEKRFAQDEIVLRAQKVRLI